MMAFPDDYSQYDLITFDHSLVGSGGVTDFDVWIPLTELSTDLQATIRSDGGDLRVTSADGSVQLPRAVIKDASGNAAGVRAKVSLSDSTDLVLRLYYNGTDTEPAATAFYGSQNAFDAYTGGYWPMENDPSGSAPQIRDLTSNANHGTTYGSMTTSDLLTGCVGSGIAFDGVNDYVDFGQDASLFPSASTSITLSIWVKSAETNGDYLITKRTSNPRILQVYWNAGKIRMVLQDSGSTQSRDQTNVTCNDGQWHKLDLVYNASTGTTTIYLDGVISTDAGFKLTNVLGDWVNNGVSLLLNTAHDSGPGGDSSAAVYDEFKCSPSVRSTAWISTSYNNESNPSAFIKEVISYGSGSEPESTSSQHFSVIGSAIIQGVSLR